MEMPWNIWNIKAGYSTDVLGGQITEGTSIHSTIQNTWTVTSNAIKKSQRYSERDGSLLWLCRRTACTLCLVRWAHCASGQGGTCSACALPRGSGQGSLESGEGGTACTQQECRSEGSELGWWVRLGHGFWGCWGVLIPWKTENHSNMLVPN